MDEQTRSNPQVIKWITKISEGARQIQILRKDVLDRERDIEQLNNEIDSKKHFSTTPYSLPACLSTGWPIMQITLTLTRFLSKEMLMLNKGRSSRILLDI